MTKKEIDVVTDAVDTYMEFFSQGTLYDSWKTGRMRISATIARRLRLTPKVEQGIYRCIDFDNYDEYHPRDIRPILFGRIVEHFLENE